MLIEREITSVLEQRFRDNPFVVVTGPRQSGKTTLCRQTFPDLQYVNLEDPDQREFAQSDPRGFLSQLDDGAVLDEVQRVPSLLSYLQVIADEKRENSLFVLTGSEQFGLSKSVNQSLAGRVSLLRLMPFSLEERKQTGADNTIDNILWSGFYPRIHSENRDPREVLSNYFETYVTRDVGTLGGVGEISGFQNFVRLCAGRVGQLLNLSSLGRDAGVSQPTVKRWLSVLERSYVTFRLRPYFANISKRLVKSPKLFFYDVGLASYLIGVTQPSQMATHPLRGELFENTVIVEVLKYRLNQGYEPKLWFFRDNKGLECDLLYETGNGVGVMEIKSSATITSAFFKPLNRVAEMLPKISTKTIVYSGTHRQTRSDGNVVPFHDLYSVFKQVEYDQEITEFVQEYRGVPEGTSDEAILDKVFRNYIRPVLDSIDQAFTQFSQLFNNFTTSIFVNGSTVSSSASSITTEEWENLKMQYAVANTFKLRSDYSLQLGMLYKFLNYRGKGLQTFDLTVLARWDFDGCGATFSVSIGAEERNDITSFNRIIDYYRLDSDADSYNVKQMVKHLCSHVKIQIQKNAHLKTS